MTLTSCDLNLDGQKVTPKRPMVGSKNARYTFYYNRLLGERYLCSKLGEYNALKVWFEKAMVSTMPGTSRVRAKS